MTDFSRGDRVFSKEWGCGTVIAVESKRILVRYDKHNDYLHDGEIGPDKRYWWEIESTIMMLTGEHTPEAPESPKKASDTVTLTLTFPEGTEVLNGVFEANNGKYLVSIEKAEW